MAGHSDSNARKVPSTGAFVTFFKSLFGAGLLALPNVLGQVGLILGVIIYIIVSLLCSLSCYYLLEAREVTEHYLLFDPARPGDYKPAYDGQNQTDQAKTAAASKPHHLVTYGDLADVLLGHTMASITRWTIIILNILFTAGLVIVICENLSDLAQDEQGAMAARRAVGLCLLPAVAAFLQIPWLQDMWIISLVGLAVYTIGVIGSTLYSAILTISGEENGRGVPDGLWDVHWGGVTTFVGSAVYAMEGINLALPTVHSMQHPSDSTWVVCGTVMLYGFVTLVFGAVGYAGGLGGGEGTGKTPEQCDVVTNCITPQSLQLTIQIALSIALLLSIPIMLYPSTEMLEVMLTDRKEECKATGYDSHKAEVSSVELRGADASKRRGSQTALIVQAGGTKKDEDPYSHEITYGTNSNKKDGLMEDTKPDEFSQDKSWKLRVFLAILVVTMGTVTKSFTHFSGFVGAVGLSFAGFVLPPLLYLRAMQQAALSIGMPKQVGMAVLALFGVCNMVVGGVSSFIALVESF